MNRVWTALLLLATVVVAGAVVYVVTHNDKVPDAGATPGYTPSIASSSSAAPSTSAGPSGSAPASSGSSGPSTAASGEPSGSGSTANPPGEIKLAVIGDNWAAGVGIDDKNDRFPQLLAAGLGAKRLAVFAKPGAGYAKHSDDGKDFGDLVDDVVANKPNVIVVTGGRNDRSDDPSTLDDAAKSLFADLHQALPNARLYAVAPFFGDSAHPSDLQKVDEAAQTGVEDADGTYLDIPDPIAGHSDYMADEANPNAQGAKAIADALVAALKPSLVG